MIYLALGLLGLCLGSFVNALVWRVHKQLAAKKPSNKYSVVKGRSMCIHCGHMLVAKDLVPLFSWLFLRGKCRYCQKPIPVTYPLVELSTAAAFVASYIFWPLSVEGFEILAFGAWLGLLTGFMALAVYDFRWMLLPNRIVFPLYGFGAVFAIGRLIQGEDIFGSITMAAGAAIVGGGLFWILFQVSRGKWIGGGDVKLGFLLGLLTLEPLIAVLMLFLASLFGTIYSLPFLLSRGGRKPAHKIPFGPFLILGCIVGVVFGKQIIEYYTKVTMGIG